MMIRVLVGIGFLLAVGVPGCFGCMCGEVRESLAQKVERQMQESDAVFLGEVLALVFRKLQADPSDVQNPLDQSGTWETKMAVFSIDRSVTVSAAGFWGPTTCRSIWFCRGMVGAEPLGGSGVGRSDASLCGAGAICNEQSITNDSRRQPRQPDRR